MSSKSACGRVWAATGVAISPKRTTKAPMRMGAMYQRGFRSGKLRPAPSVRHVLLLAMHHAHGAEVWWTHLPVQMHMSQLPVIRLRPREGRRVRAGAPWVFSNEIVMDGAAKALPPGASVTL